MEKKTVTQQQITRSKKIKRFFFLFCYFQHFVIIGRRFVISICVLWYRNLATTILCALLFSTWMQIYDVDNAEPIHLSEAIWFDSTVNFNS